MLVYLCLDRFLDHHSYRPDIHNTENCTTTSFLSYRYTINMGENSTERKVGLLKHDLPSPLYHLCLDHCKKGKEKRSPGLVEVRGRVGLHETQSVELPSPSFSC
ncbi:hypothetical protein ACQJBY_015590 [Aegilops geniculata]